MPTPERVRLAAIEKRKRVCVICSTAFMVKQSCYVGRTCSKQCSSTHRSRLKTGTTQSAETIAKRAAAMIVHWSDPDRKAKHGAASSVRLREWHSNPDNAQAFAARSSQRMKQRHTDPAFQKRRDERSSLTMKAVWDKHREHLVASALERNARHMEEGTGLWSPDAVARKNAAAKWIMKRAQAALRSDTNYVETYTEVQARLRREMPYDGPQEGSDYLDYLQELGLATINSPECRTIADAYLSEAIPRCAREYRDQREKCSDAAKHGRG